MPTVKRKQPERKGAPGLLRVGTFATRMTPLQDVYRHAIWRQGCLASDDAVLALVATEDQGMNEQSGWAPRGAERQEYAWIWDACSPEEVALLRTRMAVHEARLHHLAPAVRTTAVVEALHQDAQADPALRALLQRIVRLAVARLQARSREN